MQDWRESTAGHILDLQEGLRQMKARMDSMERQPPPPSSGASRAGSYLRRAWPVGAVLLAAVPLALCARCLLHSRR